MQSSIQSGHYFEFSVSLLSNRRPLKAQDKKYRKLDKLYAFPLSICVFRTNK